MDCVIALLPKTFHWFPSYHTSDSKPFLRPGSGLNPICHSYLFSFCCSCTDLFSFKQTSSFLSLLFPLPRTLLQILPWLTPSFRSLLQSLLLMPILRQHLPVRSPSFQHLFINLAVCSFSFFLFSPKFWVWCGQ